MFEPSAITKQTCRAFSGKKKKEKKVAKKFTASSLFLSLSPKKAKVTKTTWREKRGDGS